MNQGYYIHRVLILLILISKGFLYAKGLPLDQYTNNIELLPSAKLYIDKTKTQTIESVLKNKQTLFKKTDLGVSHGFGYSPDFNLWIEITLYNNSSIKVNKIIEYANPLTTNIEFFDPDNEYKVQYGGILHKQQDRNTLNSIFTISLEPYESKTYYIKTTSMITTLIVQLKLWKMEEFYNKEITHQVILSLFFGAMFILGVYNLFIYFFTKDRSYLYYVVYIMGLIFHQLLYVGFAAKYFFTSLHMSYIVSIASVFVSIPIFALGLFTKSFLDTAQYPVHNKILSVLLWLIPFVALFFIVSDEYRSYRNFLPVTLLLYLLYFTIYAFIKQNKQAYFILFGWFVFAFSASMMYLSSLGIFSIEKYFPYLIEVSFLLEAVIFSIALANRINSLQKEKNEATNKLIIQKKQETIKLEQTVQEKTKSLRSALSQKDILLRELNHRVKNNMQTIISLIRLQSYDIQNHKFKEYLQTIQNRISAMSHLHELLYKQENLAHIQTAVYFQTIVDELQESYSDDVVIFLKISIDLNTEEAIYCGLIVNELVTNSIKYAFNDLLKKELIISLYKKDDKNFLEVKDNGNGYDQKKEINSLGLILVETLSVEQLGGEYYIDTSNQGTKTVIKWR